MFLAQSKNEREGDPMATLSKSGAMTTALLAGVLATCSLNVRSAQAQETPAPPPPPAAEAAPAPAEAAPPPPPPAPPVVTPAVPAAAEPAATVSTDTNKVQHKKMDPPAIWFRLDNRFQSKDPSNAKK